ncbi:MAG: hypothetical protein ACETWD_10920, partial [Desulfatiglandales bacterium]
KSLKGGLSNPERAYVFLDHSAPSPQSALSSIQKNLRQFAMRTGCKLVDINGHLLRGCLHEDKTFRKQCGHLAGKELLSVEEINEKKGNNNKQGLLR